MDHATSLSQVQRANLNLLLLMRDAAMRDMGDAVCSFGLARQDFAAIMSRAPDSRTWLTLPGADSSASR